jgi:apolipoprotein N-acyltransferase
MIHALPARRRCAAAALLGAVAATGQAPLGWWPLAMAALAGLIALVASAPGARAAFWAGLAGGAGHFALALHWIVYPFLVDPVRHGWMAPFALILLSFGLALFWAGAAALSVRLPQRALGFALLLAGAEVMRGLIFTGFPWAQPGQIWADTPLAQLAALAGAHGLTLLTLGVAALPASLGPGRSAAAIAALATVTVGWSLSRLAAPEPPARDAVVRLVQPNAEQHLKWAPDWAEAHFSRALELTAIPGGRPGLAAPDLVIWPETSVPYMVEDGGEITRAIHAAAPGGVPVAAGIQRIGDTGVWNALAVIGPGGRITAHYDKHHLVPFGEYIPFGDWLYDRFGLAAFASQAGAGYRAGTGPGLMDFGPALGRALPLICYEAIFPRDVNAAPERADWLLQITNDAWFGPWAGPAQHFAQARLRAVEQGLPLVRVANTGISAVVDARGRVADGASSPPGTAAVLDSPLPGALPPTPYARHGDLIPVGLWLAGLALAAFARPRRRIA